MTEQEQWVFGDTPQAWDAYAEQLTSAWLLDPWTDTEDIRTWMRGQRERIIDRAATPPDTEVEAA